MRIREESTSYTKRAANLSVNAELLDQVFPGVPRLGDIGAHTTLLSIDKARRVLGYDPQFSWRDKDVVQA